MRVLIAHSDPATRSRLREPLERAGCEVLESDTVGDTVAACRRHRPEVAVLSELAGLEAIKSDAEAFGTAVLLVAEREPALDDALAALAGGAQDLLVEPVRAAEIVARVRAAGRTRQLQEELWAQTTRLEALLHRDPLTGALNRRSVLIQLAGLVSGARRHGRPLSVVMIDVDRFKALNDRHGHQAGDRALTMTAHAMRERLRAEDLLGRLGGEEFIAVLPDTAEDAAAVAAERLRAGVANGRPAAGGPELNVTISAGWATWDGREGPEELVRRADEALYAAKLDGRDTVRGAPRGSASLRDRA